MRVRLVCAFVVPGVVGALLAVPAGAEDGARSLPSLPRPQGVLLEVGPDGPVSHRSPGDVLAATRRFGQDGTALRALADAAAAAGQPASLVVPTAAATESDAVAVLSFAAAVPAGDLDGDGRADVLTYTAEEDGPLELVARRGTDGALLWSRALEASSGALAYAAQRDFTGDGVDDLLLDELSVEGQVSEQESATGFTSSFEGTVRHGYGVVSGADGTTVWSRAVGGAVSERFAFTGDPLGLAGDVQYRLRSRNLAVLALLSDDADGDGLPDVVVNEVDLDVDERSTGAGAGLVGDLFGAAYRDGLVVSSRTRAQLVSGDDGAVTALRTADAQSGIALAVPVGQVSGTPLADVAWSTDRIPAIDRTCVATPAASPCLDRSTGAAQVSVELLEDGTGRRAWTTTVPGFGGFVTPAGGDLDGTGTTDLALALVDGDGGRLVVLSGDDGRTLWDARSSLFPPSLIGTAPGADGVVAVVAEVAAEQDELVAVTTRRDGRTGAVLGSDRYEATAPDVEPGEGGALTFSVVGVSTTDDGDGDGGAEQGVFSFSVALSFDEQFEVVDEAARSGAEYRALATGELLLAEAADELRLLVPAGGDLDGDGLADLQREVYPLSEQEAGSSAGLRLVDGRSLWRLDDAFPLAAGDQDGVPGQELLVVRDGADGLETASLRGADAGQRWSASARRPR